MNEDDSQTRFERLELRLAHQEAAVEELTRTLLVQEKKVKEQAEAIEMLQQQIRSLAVSQVASAEDETPPPHY